VADDASGDDGPVKAQFVCRREVPAPVLGVEGKRRLKKVVSPLDKVAKPIGPGSHHKGDLLRLPESFLTRGVQRVCGVRTGKGPTPGG
jgi:hypothetical protein